MPEEGVAYKSKAGRWILAISVLGSGMAFLDGTVVNVALPDIGRDLHASTASLQWILNGYLLTLASVILLGGERQQVAVEDPLQRRRGGMEITADVRQRDVDHRAVQERHPGADTEIASIDRPPSVGHPLFGHGYRLS